MDTITPIFFRINRARRGRGYLLFFLFVSLFLCVFSTTARCAEIEGRLLAPAESQALLARIKESQAQVKTIIASFTEERKIAALANPLIFRGTVYVEPEDFLFLQYEQPLRHIMKMAGDSVLFFVEGSDTADMVDLAGAQKRGQRPDLFNWSPENFQGEIREVAEGYQLGHAETESGGRRIQVVIDKKNLVVRHILLIDESGDQTTINLTDVRLNKQIPAAIRNYTLPHGVRIHKLNQP